MSHPPRGAWIEIRSRRGEKIKTRSRTPHGVRGLKFLQGLLHTLLQRSHPPRGAWIEISMALRRDATIWSHPPRGAWIEIRYQSK